MDPLLLPCHPAKVTAYKKGRKAKQRNIDVGEQRCIVGLHHECQQGDEGKQRNDPHLRCNIVCRPVNDLKNIGGNQVTQGDHQDIPIPGTPLLKQFHKQKILQIIAKAVLLKQYIPPKQRRKRHHEIGQQNFDIALPIKLPQIKYGLALHGIVQAKAGQRQKSIYAGAGDEHIVIVNDTLKLRLINAAIVRKMKYEDADDRKPHQGAAILCNQIIGQWSTACLVALGGHVAIFHVALSSVVAICLPFLGAVAVERQILCNSCSVQITRS